MMTMTHSVPCADESSRMSRDEGVEWLRSHGFSPSHERLMGAVVESFSIIWNGSRWSCAILGDGRWCAWFEVGGSGARCLFYGDSPSMCLDGLVESHRRGRTMIENLWRNIL